MSLSNRYNVYYLWEALDAEPKLSNGICAFLLNPEKIVVYFGETHLGIEYIGPIKKDKLDEQINIELQYFDFRAYSSEDFLNQIIGFSFDGPEHVRLPLLNFVEDLYVPTNKAHDIMIENGWNFSAQSMMLGLNTAGFYLLPNKFARMTNSFFYGTDEHGLLTRHFQWIDFLPIVNARVDEFRKSIALQLWPNMRERAHEDAIYEYPQPNDFQYEKLVKLNRFVELFSSPEVTEPEITRFLAQKENQFILKMVFFSREIQAERLCEWAEVNQIPIRPDFFVVQPNGYADIVEFKLPTLKSKSVVGRENRETFSAEIHQYVAQTRVYKDNKNL